jgi:hypothetical protein
VIDHGEEVTHLAKFHLLTVASALHRLRRSR